MGHYQKFERSKLMALRGLRKFLPETICGQMCDLFFPHRLSHVIMDLSSACNAACPYCPRNDGSVRHDHDVIMSRNVFETIYRQLEHMTSVKTISLYAFGEALLNPEAGKFIDDLSRLHRSLILSTNTTNIDRFAESLMKLDLLQFSIEGHDKCSYEANRKNLNFDETCRRLAEFDKAIKARRREGLHAPHRQVHCLLVKDTRIEPFLRQWAPYVDEIRFSVLGPSLSWTAEGHSQFSYPTGLRERCFLFDRKLPGNSVCTYVEGSVTLDAAGTAVLCCGDFERKIKLGDCRDIKSAFRHPFMRALRMKMLLGEPHLCDRCRVFWGPDESLVRKTFPELLDLGALERSFGVKISM